MGVKKREKIATQNVLECHFWAQCIPIQVRHPRDCIWKEWPEEMDVQARAVKKEKASYFERKKSEIKNWNEEIVPRAIVKSTSEQSGVQKTVKFVGEEEIISYVNEYTDKKGKKLWK